MTHTIVAVGGFMLLALLMAIRVPVGFAMGIAGAAGFGAIVGLQPALRLFSQVPLTVATNYDLSIIPMFILMGAFASRSGLSLELFRASRAWIGHFRGGLALSTLLSCAGFAAINGSSIATAATMTRVALPEMEREGYHSSLSTGVIAAGGTLGIMIPPSAVFALYGIMTEQNISKLFIAGILPGILGVIFYGLAVRGIGFLRPDHVPASPRESWRVRFMALRDVWAVLVLFGFVIGGIYGGVFTVTEAAGVGAAGTWAIGALRRRLDFKATIECLIEALRITSAIFAIVIGALIFGYFLAITQTTQNLSFWITSLPLGPYGILAIILLAYFVLGAVMDELAITLLTLPIVFPIIVQLGFDPIWFGVIFVMTVTLGMNTPPVGMNVFVINSIARHVPLTDIYRGVAPFIAADIVRLIILVAFPTISLLLPMSMK